MSGKQAQFSMPQDAVLSLGSLSMASAPARASAYRTKAARWRFFLARNAIFHGLRALGISQGGRVLVPAYICKAAVEPILAYGAEPVFYEVRRNCEPELQDLERRLSDKVEAVLLVHYFGFPQNAGFFRDFCNQHKLKLIEDCAHVLSGEVNGQTLGALGDVSVFSWRKFFPLYDGGELCLNFAAENFAVNWLPESAKFTARVVKRVVDQSAEEGRSVLSKALSASLSLGNRLFSNSANGHGDRGGLEESAGESRTASLDKSLLNQPMSRVSKWLLAHSDREKIAGVRRQNYRFLETGLKSVAGVTPLHGELPPTICPWVFPIFFDGRANGHVALRKKGIPAVAWEGVRPGGVSRADFPSADFLYENLAFLPVHQSLSESDLGRIVEAVKQFAESSS
jgi:perosamine synthetase